MTKKKTKLTAEQISLVLSTAAVYSNLGDLEGLSNDEIGATLFKYFGQPEPDKFSTGVTEELLEAITQHSTKVLGFTVSTPPDGYTEEERREHILTQLLENFSTKFSEVIDSGCDCDKCTLARKVAKLHKDLSASGEALVNRQDEILGVFLEIGMPKELLTEMFVGAKIPDPFQAGTIMTPTTGDKPTYH